MILIKLYNFYITQSIYFIIVHCLCVLTFCNLILLITTPLTKTAHERVHLQRYSQRPTSIHWMTASGQAKSRTQQAGSHKSSRKLSKASTALGGQDLVQLGIPESPEYYYDAGVSFFLQWEWKGCYGRRGDVPREGAQLHIALPHWAETHTHFCLTR